MTWPIKYTSKALKYQYITAIFFEIFADLRSILVIKKVISLKCTNYAIKYKYLYFLILLNPSKYNNFKFAVLFKKPSPYPDKQTVDKR